MLQTRAKLIPGPEPSRRGQAGWDFAAGGLTAGIVSFNVETMNNKDLPWPELNATVCRNQTESNTRRPRKRFAAGMTFSSGSIRGVVRT
jgi:hypothetical protein